MKKVAKNCIIGAIIYGACQCEKGHFSVLITNKHVIDDIESCELTFHLQDEDGHVLNENLIYRLDGINKDTWLRHPDSKIDLAMLNLSPIFEHISNSGKKVFYTCLDSTLIPNQEDVNSFSVIEDIIMLGYPNGIIDEKNNIDKYAKMFELTDKLNNDISSFSHGMKQKVALIAALAHDPKILIMDEPFVGLDPKAVYDVKEIMKEMTKSGKTIFFSTHILDVAEKLCDRVAIIKNGKIVKIGKMKDIKGDESLEEVFLELGDK